jgi:hypothetical protein
MKEQSQPPDYFTSERVTGIEPALSAWESVRLQRFTWPDLRIRMSAGDRERPLITEANCTLIARVPRLDRMAVADTRIVLRAGGSGDPIVDHPGQPADYVHTDGTVWTWLGRWRLVGGVRMGDRIVDRDLLRMYDLVMSSGDDE